jgi:hypothetical protein
MISEFGFQNSDCGFLNTDFKIRNHQSEIRNSFRCQVPEAAYFALISTQLNAPVIFNIFYCFLGISFGPVHGLLARRLNGIDLFYF